MSKIKERHPLSGISGIPLLCMVCLSLLFITACQTIGPTATDAVGQPLQTESPASLQNVTQPSPAVTDTLTNTPLPATDTPDIPRTESTSTPYPDDFWMDLPVIPNELSDHVREVYKKGLEMGNDPHVFTKIGDCNSMSPDFLAGFGGNYDLGENTSLQPAIDYFKGAFRLPNQATNPGTTTSRVLVSLWTNDQCEANEIMLDCQYRLDNPSIAIIALGTIDAKYHQRDPQAFERNMRVIIESTLSRGIVPVLATKADNIEGDNSINATIARLAMEYELPLWNFWKAAQPLVNHGLQPDLEHLNKWSDPPSTDFSLPISMDYGKEVKNFTALQVLDFLMQELAVP